MSVLKPSVAQEVLVGQVEVAVMELLTQLTRGWTSSLWDLDEWLAYQTPKVVVIKDRVLGIIRLLGMIIVIGLTSGSLDKPGSRR